MIDELTDKESAIQINKADLILGQMVAQDGEAFFDYAYPLWVRLTHTLTDMGWKPEELMTYIGHRATTRSAKDAMH